MNHHPPPPLPPSLSPPPPPPPPPFLNATCNALRYARRLASQKRHAVRWRMQKNALCIGAHVFG